MVFVQRPEEMQHILADVMQGKSWQGRREMTRRDGSKLAAYFSLFPFHCDGKVVGRVGITSAQPQSTSLLSLPAVPTVPSSADKSVVMPVATVKMDNTNQIIWCNDAFLRAFGYLSMHLVIGKQMNALIAAHTTDGMVRTADGFCTVDGFDLPAHGLRVFCFRNASARRKLEVAMKQAAAEMEKISFRTNFMTTISHEMRTPLNGIIGELDNLECYIVDQAPELSKEFVDIVNDSICIIQSSSKIQLMLVNNILGAPKKCSQLTSDWQKLIAGKMQISNERIDLPSLVSSTVHNYRCWMRSKNISCSLSTPKSLPQHVMGDRLKMTQILLNYLSNAIKFSPLGGHITMSCHADDQNNTLVFAVEDDGPGVKEDHRHLLFKRFVQLPSERPESLQAGTGLGLSICHEMAVLLNGVVWFESRPEGGSRFLLSIPLIDASECVDEPVDNSDAVAYNSTRSRRRHTSLDYSRPVLVVEDNMINCRVFVKMLKKLGFQQIDLAMDGIEALSACEKHEYELIFMDMSMPRMNGVDATTELRLRGCRASIVVVSANVMDEHRTACYDAGCDAFIAKPVQIAHVQSYIQSNFAPQI